MSEAGDYGIGLIGLGAIAQTHLRAYANAGLRIVGGAEIDSEKREKSREFWNLPYVTGDYRELIARDDVQVVDVNVPHRYEIRKPIIECAARAGKAIFVQKPLLPYLDQARELVEIAERHDTAMMVNQNSLFVPAFLSVEQHLRDGSLGKPYYFQIENRSWWDPGSHPWFAKTDRWITADMAVHHFALIHHWFGEWESVHALMTTDPAQSQVKGDNLSVISVQFRNGVKGCVINNWCYRGPHRRPHAVEEIVVQCDNGCLSGHAEDMMVVTANPATEVRLEITGKWWPDAFGNAMEHFIEALREGKPFLSSGRSNLSVIAMIEAAYKSSTEGKVVRREEVWS
jgi:predicted dehydrogenase